MVDLGKVVASLELETAGFTGGINEAVKAAQALGNLEGVGRAAVNGLIAGAADRRRRVLVRKPEPFAPTDGGIGHQPLRRADFGDVPRRGGAVGRRHFGA